MKFQDSYRAVFRMTSGSFVTVLLSARSRSEGLSRYIHPEADRHMDQIRKIFGFFERLCSIYSRMAVFDSSLVDVLRLVWDGSAGGTLLLRKAAEAGSVMVPVLF